MKLRTQIAASAACVIATASLAADTVTGKVTKVRDADTVVVAGVPTLNDVSGRPLLIKLRDGLVRLLSPDP